MATFSRMDRTHGYADEDLVAIGDAARILGVSVPTVRRWEDDEDRIQSQRTPGGRRRYRVADLRALLAASGDAA
jgi:predicted site-specific integrase-resolvase